jgi:hypothetical protein
MLHHSAFSFVFSATGMFKENAPLIDFRIIRSFFCQFTHILKTPWPQLQSRVHPGGFKTQDLD